VLEFSLIALSGYLISLFYDYYYVVSIFFFVGLGLVRYGLKYRDRDKINKEIREERERRKGIPKTNSEVAGIVGLMIFFAGLGMGLIDVYVVRGASLIALSLLLFAVGILIIFISSILIREERRKEREKSLYTH
jgi:hypothetical protein